jgi:hypothetical protein
MATSNDAHAKLEAMTAARQQATHGSLMVIMAIASITDLVMVDTTVSPFTFKPPNLPNLTFNDPLVGIQDGQMPIFKSNLSKFLPEISADIDKIPNDAAVFVRNVANYINTCLLGVS